MEELSAALSSSSSSYIITTTTTTTGGKALKSFSKDKIKMTMGRTPRHLDAIEARDFAIFLDATVKFRDQVKKYAPENAIPTQKDREFYMELYQQLAEKYAGQGKKIWDKCFYIFRKTQCSKTVLFIDLYRM